MELIEFFGKPSNPYRLRLSAFQSRIFLWSILIPWISMPIALMCKSAFCAR